MTTVTGRTSHSQPKMQNIPGSLADALDWAMERGQITLGPDSRWVISVDPGAPGFEGAALAEVDYSGVEARILALYVPDRRRDVA